MPLMPSQMASQSIRQQRNRVFQDQLSETGSMANSQEKRPIAKVIQLNNV